MVLGSVESGVEDLMDDLAEKICDLMEYGFELHIGGSVGDNGGHLGCLVVVFGSRDDGEVANLFGDGDEDMVGKSQSEEERQER
ncbi:hypothetical protein SO802_029073 [Lithocarpus litseifolius]|uniref:Uncharacterized protein n=1 Tax=Lithocarpus litseifolius TaxID=425828 RepID=A0AAW2BVK7_9ROSI